MRHLLLVLALLNLTTAMKATEEPAFEIVQKLGDVEVRSYQGYLVAEVLIAATAEQAGNRAFPLLAGYIFGKNKGERKLEMTAPVKQTPVPVKLEMTAPVAQTQVASGEYLVQFVLPAGVTLATAPEPLDTRVRVREVPACRVGVLRFSGLWSASNYSKHLKELQEALKNAGLKWTGEPTYSRYNPPWTPWFMRRNEIWLTLEEGPQAGG